MKRSLVKAFWRCGDSDLIEYAMQKARLNEREKQVLVLSLDEQKTQEEIAEILDLSVRKIQSLWKNASDKLINLPWLVMLANVLLEEQV